MATKMALCDRLGNFTGLLTFCCLVYCDGSATFTKVLISRQTSSKTSLKGSQDKESAIVQYYYQENFIGKTLHI